MRKSNIESLAEIIGKGLNVKENKKSIKNKEKQFLIEIVKILCELEASVNSLNVLGVNIFELEEKYVFLIRNLLIKVYGEIKSNIIIWWVYESINSEGEILPLEDEDGKKHLIRTPTQLIKFLKRYDGK